MIVIDASAMIEVLLDTDAAGRIKTMLLEAKTTPHAPHLIDVEIAHVLRRLAAKGEISDRRAELALVDMAAFPLQRYPHQPFLTRIWELRHNLSSYDAAYVVLAEALNAVLVTRDKRLAASSGHDVSMELI